MRKFLGIATIATVATVAFGASPALAGCPSGSGTVPGSPSKVTTVSAGGTTIYVDDRDYTDTGVGPDVEDGGNGGIWLYLESGKKVGLQRGGNQVPFVVLKSKGVDPSLPYIKPVVTPLPHPTKPGEKLTLFPAGFGGGSIAQTAGSHDDCVRGKAAHRDMIIF